MLKLISAYWQICLFRCGPQDLPYSTVLFYLTLAAYLSMDFVLSVQDLSFGDALLASIVDATVLLSFSGVLLWMRSLTARMIQTFSALLGSSTLLGIIALPLLSWQLALGTDSPDIILPSFLLLAILIWNLAVVGHILRHALSSTTGVGIGLALLYIFISINVMRSLFYTG